MAVVRAVALSALSAALYGCGGGGKSAKLCCIQCGDAVGLQYLHCRTASSDLDAEDNTCGMDDMGLSGHDLNLCESQQDWYEHVGANSTAAPNAYGPAAAKFWQDGNDQTARGGTFEYMHDHPDCHPSFGNNRHLSANEIVQNHRERLASLGHLVAVRGVLYHPLDAKLGGFMDFLGAVINLVMNALENILNACTDTAEDIEKCLGFVGLPRGKEQIFAVSTNHSEAVFAQLAAALQATDVTI